MDDPSHVNAAYQRYKVSSTLLSYSSSGRSSLFLFDGYPNAPMSKDFNRPSAHMRHIIEIPGRAISLPAMVLGEARGGAASCIASSAPSIRSSTTLPRSVAFATTSPAKIATSGSPRMIGGRPPWMLTSFADLESSDVKDVELPLNMESQGGSSVGFFFTPRRLKIECTGRWERGGAGWLSEFEQCSCRCA